MTQQPYGTSWPSGAYPTMPPMAPRAGRPGWVTALAVISIVFCSMGLLSPLQNLAMRPVLARQREAMRRQGVRQAPFVTKLQEAAERNMVVTMVPGLVFSALGLAGGIGMLKLRRWGRVLSIAYAIGGLVMPVLVAVTLALGTDVGLGNFGLPEMMVVGCVGLLIFVYPVILLAFLLPARRAAVFK